MLGTLSLLLDLLVSLIQPPVLTIACIAICGVIMYAFEQKAGSRQPPPQDDK